MHRGPPVKPSINVDLDILWAVFPSEIKLMNKTKCIGLIFSPTTSKLQSFYSNTLNLSCFNIEFTFMILG